MKKIGIVTHSNSMNYGGILQAVALSRTLRKIGLEPVNITCHKMTPAWHGMVLYAKRRIRYYGCKGVYTKIRILGGMLKTLFSNVHYFVRKEKQKKFKNFIMMNLNTTSYFKSDKKLREKASGFDGYITGSDQVWNDSFADKSFLNRFFLEFVPEKTPCYSYAASTGGKKSDEYVKEIIDRTNKFLGRTVREKSLEVQMRQLGAIDVKTVIDPVLLLKKEEWCELQKKPKMKIPHKYILVYFLEKTAEQEEIIKKIALELKLPVVDIMPDYKKVSYQKIADYTAGPAEFIYYVNHAEYIITNSFHMTVFSMIFQKKFIALQRQGQESRVQDLLLEYGMQQRIIRDFKDWKCILEAVPSIETQLIFQREEAMNFLLKIRESL